MSLPPPRPPFHTPTPTPHADVNNGVGGLGGLVVLCACLGCAGAAGWATPHASAWAGPFGSHTHPIIPRTCTISTTVARQGKGRRKTKAKEKKAKARTRGAVICFCLFFLLVLWRGFFLSCFDWLSHFTWCFGCFRLVVAFILRMQNIAAPSSPRQAHVQIPA